MWIKKKSPIADGDRNYGDSALNIFVFLHRRLWPALGWFQDAPRLELDAGEEAVISKRSADALAERRRRTDRLPVRLPANRRTPENDRGSAQAL
ncbi:MULTISPECIES: hypothetical protein [Bradyrhizobium]|uniref:hypothetical protein n=1 Tax=Bradyrhizobium TaxID=374 RepID=UPI0012F4E225|nr:hypothetical protein [Bradyrhizobium sp. CCBAU 15544]